jgi:diaminohydroxyphosphoribosylaminopyrimidine deaminase/5-amino-6-(5-phosphoribosylamino)uracil reductase
MAMALDLAARGRGSVEPNPLVGAVVTRAGRIVGRGHHARFGGPHAEAVALREAGRKARGGTLYVTLEPCSFFGKTPPCADAVVEAGVERVVAAMRDPNPKVRGRGAAKLRRAGVEVEFGVLRREAAGLNAPYVKLVTKGIPFFTAKWAMTLDGKTATAGSRSKWITGRRSRAMARRLRPLASAVMVGVGTVLADDPHLGVRKAGRRSPLRIVVDSRLRLPLDSQIVRTAADGEVLVATTFNAPEGRIKALARANVIVIPFPEHDGRVDLRAMAERLGRMQITNVFVEGGGTLVGKLFDEGLVDRIVAFIAPKILGGRDSLTPVEGHGAESVDRAARLRVTHLRAVGGDVLIEADVLKPRGSSL